MVEKYRSVSSEVLYSNTSLTTVDKSFTGSLRQLLIKNFRHRIRLCAHASPDESLHEMLIAIGRGSYIRPHRHPGKTESIHVIEGLADLVVLSECGEVEQVIRLGDYASRKIFFYRMDVPLLHTLVIRSEVFIFHETTNGPFNIDDTQFPEWAPENHDANLIEAFMTMLEKKIKSFSTAT